MTKRFVSEKSGMPYSSLNSKLKGYRGFDLDDILALAEAIGESPSELLPPQFTKNAPRPPPKTLSQRSAKEVRNEWPERC